MDQEEYINIDSRHRSKKTLNIHQWQTTLPQKGSLSIIQNGNNTILQMDISGLREDLLQSLKVNSLITIQGIEEEPVKYYHQNQNPLISNNEDPQYIDVNIDLGLQGLSQDQLEGLYVTIDGFQDDNVNQMHKVLYKDLSQMSSAFQIKTNERINQDNVTNHYLTIKKHFSNGIPHSLMNSFTPVTSQNVKTHHQVTFIDHQQMILQVLIDDRQVPSSIVLQEFGNNIQIGLIHKTIQQYINPNDFQISLNDTYDNVQSAELFKYLIPDVRKTFYEGSNRLYWQIKGHQKVHMTTFKSVYCKTIEDLASCIEKHVFDSQDVPLYQCIIEHSNDLKIYFQRTLYINQDIQVEGTSMMIKISKSNDNTDYEVNEKVIIEPLNEETQKFLNSNGSQRYLVSDFQRGIDENDNLIVIQLNDSNDHQNQTVKMLFKMTFKVHSKLFFDKQDTIGDILGFNEVKNHKSVTEFKKIHSNHDLYISGHPFLGIQNGIKLSNIEYIKVMTDLFKNVHDTNDEMHLLDVIYFDDPCYRPVKKTLRNIVDKFDRLSIRILDQDDHLIDFQGQELQMILKIVYKL